MLYDMVAVAEFDQLNAIDVVIQDERLGHVGSPPRELETHDHSWISRTTTKLRSVKSGFGALNAAHRIDDLLLQVNDADLTFTLLNWEM